MPPVLGAPLVVLTEGGPEFDAEPPAVGAAAEGLAGAGPGTVAAGREAFSTRPPEAAL